MKQYLAILAELRDKLVSRGATANRTAVKAVKVVGRSMRFDLSDGTIPLLTTKKLHLKSIVAELIWFLSGSTNNEELREHGVRIWDEWALPEDEYTLSAEEVKRHYVRALAEAEDLTPSQALARVEEAIAKGTEEALYEASLLQPPRNRIKHAKGDLGPLYGRQWRRFPAGDYFKSRQMSWEELSAYMVAMAPDQRAYLEEEAGVMTENGQSGIDVSVARDILTELGIDQISQALHLLKTNPNSRRIVVTAWNPQVVPNDTLSPQDNVRQHRAALASCHQMFQFVTEELTEEERIELFRRDVVTGSMLSSGDLFAGATVELKGIRADSVRQRNGNPYPTHRLSCVFTQRSNDFFLGVPYNVASYAILTRMVAQVVNMMPGEVVWNGADVHLYANCLEQANEQLTREPYPLPRLELNPKVTNLFDFTFEDFTLHNYQAHPSIKAEVAV